MRITAIVLALSACVVLVTCSTGGGDPYAAPNMGSPKDLTYAHGTPVTAATALSTLQSAMAGATSGVGVRGIPVAKTTASQHLTFYSTTPGIDASGSADYTANVTSTSESISVTQQLTVTASNVSIPPYTVSGKMVCNLAFDMQMDASMNITGGSLKVGYGIACTIDSPGASAKYILSFSAGGSLSSLANLPLTGTLYVYNSADDTPITTIPITGSNFSDFIVIAGSGPA